MANVQVWVMFIDTLRGGQHLFYDQFKYHCKKTIQEKKHWSCVFTGCKASVITQNDILQAFLQLHHTNQPVPFKMEVKAFKFTLIYRPKTETMPIPTIYGDEVSRLRRHQYHNVVPDDLLKEIPSFASLKTILYRQRHKTIPRLPATRREIQLEGEWTLTEAGEPFLHCIDDNIIIFTTKKNIERLCAADTVYGDGTFTSAPWLFEQIYTLHAEYQGYMFPFIYCLLPNKSEHTYSRTLEHLHQMAHQLDCSLDPRTLQLDFELAAYKAVRSVFPNTLLRGCFFHLMQCIWPRVQKEGLASHYKDDDEVRRLVRRAVALPLVPLDKVDDVWLDAIADSPADPKARVIMDYVITTWVALILT